ncbi:MAG: cytochrome c-type biogenesis protein CcmH [Nitrosomonas sp. PRO4]|nr:cytochrome c-type biogenesis protein CcmH [Nitrosomonas sp. PRO4]
MIYQLNGVMKVAKLLFFLLLLMIPLIGWAKEAVPVAEDPEVEKRMLALTMDLRCLVCQNEPISDSRAEFSNDIRREIREQIKANKSDEEIVQFLVDRYGDFILYNPPMKSTTILLWFGPIILFVISLGALIFHLRRRRVQVQDIALSPEQLAQAEALLDEEKKGKKV